MMTYLLNLMFVLVVVCLGWAMIYGTCIGWLSVLSVICVPRQCYYSANFAVTGNLCEVQNANAQNSSTVLSGGIGRVEKAALCTRPGCNSTVAVLWSHV